MIRKATIKDIKAIHKLLIFYGGRGELLARPFSQLYDHVRDFQVFVDQGDQIIGCCALQFCWEDLAEIRSLAVLETYQRQQIGTQLIRASLDEARAFGITKAFTLTYKPEFFKKFNFKLIDRAELPLKIWSDCITCVKFPDCDETAMMIELAG